MSLLPDDPAGSIVVIRKRATSLPPRLRREALLFGLVAGAFLDLGLYANAYGQMDRIWTYSLIFVIFMWPVWKFRTAFRPIADARGASTVGVVYSLGLMATFIPGLAIRFYYSMSSAFANFNSDVLKIAITFSMIIGVVLFLLIPTVLTGVWKLVCLTPPKFVKQNGTLCICCGYCLLGSTDMRCPECGRAFTYEEVETTESEFKSRSTAIGDSN